MGHENTVISNQRLFEDASRDFVTEMAKIKQRVVTTAHLHLHSSRSYTVWNSVYQKNSLTHTSNQIAFYLNCILKIMGVLLVWEHLTCHFLVEQPYDPHEPLRIADNFSGLSKGRQWGTRQWRWNWNVLLTTLSHCKARSCLLNCVHSLKPLWVLVGFTRNLE